MEAINIKSQAQSVLFVTEHIDDVEKQAKLVLCTNIEKKDSACENCRSCMLFEDHTHPDYQALMTNKEDKIPRIKIEQISKALDFAQRTAKVSKFQVVVIESVDSMSLSAANALLKNLEEPKEGLYWFLQTQKSLDILPTIKSRVQVVNLNESPYEQESDLHALGENALYERIYKIMAPKNDILSFMEEGLERFKQEIKVLSNALLMHKISPIQLSELMKTHTPSQTLNLMSIIYTAHLMWCLQSSNIYSKIYSNILIKNKDFKQEKTISTEHALKCISLIEEKQWVLSGQIVPTATYIIDDLLITIANIDL